MSKIQWYTLDEIMKHNCQYYMIFGMRSNGKSYSVQKYLIDEYFRHGHEFVIMKRYQEDMKTKTCSTMLAHLQDYILEEYNHNIKFYQGKWYCYEEGYSGKLADCKVMGYATSVSESDRIKGSQFPNVVNVLLEEFMSMNCYYLNDEVNLFINLISTIGRNRTNLKIFMLANAISKFSPYSSALNVKLHRMKDGEIIEKTYTNEDGYKTKFAIQRTKKVEIFNNELNKEKIVYNNFGNAGVGGMITSGEFETHAFNLERSGVTFQENKNLLPHGKYTYLNKENKLPIVIMYEDYCYRLYKHIGTNTVYGFKEISVKDVNSKNTVIAINNTIYVEGITNINNLARFYCKNDKLNKELNEIVHALHQDNVIFLNADNAEDVKSAFKLSGILL